MDDISRFIGIVESSLENINRELKKVSESIEKFDQKLEKVEDRMSERISRIETRLTELTIFQRETEPIIQQIKDHMEEDEPIHSVFEKYAFRVVIAVLSIVGMGLLSWVGSAIMAYIKAEGRLP
ncbi:hypothetical protein FACS1894216_01430 [Synergistales bacterium]|nr:hypothetical protein FACS1894216_01430 [Synergistales bacterium]